MIQLDVKKEDGPIQSRFLIRHNIRVAHLICSRRLLVVSKHRLFHQLYL